MIGEHVSRSLLHQATHKINTMFSTNSLKSWELENQSKPSQEKSYPSILYRFTKYFLKMYSIRIVFGFVTNFLSKGIKAVTLKNLFDMVFNRKNLWTSLFVAGTPSLYDLLHKIGQYFFDVNSKIFTFFSGLIAGLIGIFIEDKTDLIRFVVFSILIRTLHSLIYLFALKNGYSTSNRFLSFMALYSLAAFFHFSGYCMPEYKPIYKLFSSYGMYVGREAEEFKHVLRGSKIFDDPLPE
mmetsp:Transcript_23121/g.24060  ORF Transcript_23121/g.24060 Transcript_23121/m.24060 type:complete len:239 (-) Transcript_23121:93-809(-)